MAVTPPRTLAEADDRALFDCGRDSLNNWFRRHAWNNHVAGLSRVSVITDAATGQETSDKETSGKVIGYVTLSAAQIERAYLPKPQQRNRPDPVPVFLMGQLAVDKDFQRQGHAASLLFHALSAALRASELIGSMGVITHPLDDGLRGFYARWGFQDLPYDPRRAMIVRTCDLAMSFGSAAP